VIYVLVNQATAHGQTSLTSANNYCVCVFHIGSPA
jgi:hypothetical protein